MKTALRITSDRPSVFRINRGKTWGGKEYRTIAGQRYLPLSGSAQYAVIGSAVVDGSRVGIVRAIAQSIGNTPMQIPTWWASIEWADGADADTLRAAISACNAEAAEKAAMA